METTKHILFVALIATIAPTICYANFNGSDDFNDNTKDPAKWGTDFIQGSGALTETSQRLQYTAAGTVAGEVVIRPWIANNGSSTAGWTIQMDVNLPTLTLASGQAYEIGVGVRNGDDFSDNYGVVLELDSFFPDVGHRSFSAHQNLNGVEQSDVFTDTASTSATVRIRYDALTKTLFGEADANGAVGGYTFTTFDSQNIAAWIMTAASVFIGSASADSSGNMVVASTDNVFGDNFAGAVPEPSTWVLLVTGLGFAASTRPRRVRS